MPFTIQKNVTIISAGAPVTGCVRVTDTNGSTWDYGVSVQADGSVRLGGCFGIEDSARRQAAQSFLTYQFVPSSSIQIQRLANGTMEVYDGNQPIHAGGNTTRYAVNGSRVSNWVVGSGPDAYAAQVNAWLSSHNF